MVDAEVLRLRKLRNVALRTRALGRFIHSNLDACDSVFAKGSVLCWSIARVATGRLRSHPYESYQRDHGQFAGLTDAAIAAALATAAGRRKRELDLFADRLQAVAREVDDVRSVSLSPDLSDVLGRIQIQMRKIIAELDCKLPTQRIIAGADRRPLQGMTLDDSWPYLAI